MRTYALALAFLVACSTPLSKPTQDTIVSILASMKMLSPLLLQGHDHFAARLPLYEAVLMQLSAGVITDPEARANLLAIFALPPDKVAPAIATLPKQ